MAKHYIIYETKNLIDGKIYIGMHETDNLNDGYLGSGKRLKRAIRYHGKEFFERKILFTLNNREEMIAKEIELVTEEFVQRKDTYNIMKGGKGGFISAEQQLNRAKAASAAFVHKLKTDKKFRKEHSKRHSERFKKMHTDGKLPSWKPRTGIRHSEETINKMKNSHSGKNNSQYGTKWINNGIESKKISKKDKLPIGWELGRK